LQEIERRPLGRQQAAGGTLDLQHGMIGDAAPAFGHQPMNLYLRIDLPQRGLDPGRTADHRGFARQHPGPDTPAGIDQACRQIASAHVFRERAFGIGSREFAHAAGGKIKNACHPGKHSRIVLSSPRSSTASPHCLCS
jgi:hypothetical protein